MLFEDQCVYVCVWTMVLEYSGLHTDATNTAVYSKIHSKLGSTISPSPSLPPLSTSHMHPQPQMFILLKGDILWLTFMFAYKKSSTLSSSAWLAFHFSMLFPLGLHPICMNLQVVCWVVALILMHSSSSSAVQQRYSAVQCVMESGLQPSGFHRACSLN